MAVKTKSMPIKEVVDVLNQENQNVTMDDLIELLENIGIEADQDTVLEENVLKKLSNNFNVVLPPVMKKAATKPAPKVVKEEVKEEPKVLGPQKIEVSNNQVKLNIGEKSRYRATVIPTTMSQDVSYASSNNKVVSVDQKGACEAKTLGEATITITSKADPNVKYSFTITVVRPRIKSLAIHLNPSRLYVGKTAQVIVEVQPELADDSVIYTVMDTNVIDVDESGMVLAMGEGHTTLTAVSKTDSTVGKSISVDVINPDNVDEEDEDLDDIDDKQDRGGTKKVKGNKKKQTLSHKKEPQKLENNYRTKKSKNVSQEKPAFIYFDQGMTVAQAADAMHVSISDVIKGLLSLNIFQSGSDPIDREHLELIADGFGIKLRDRIDDDMTQFEKMKIEDDPKDLKPRPAIVTVMGHVDHGKTTLLDYIRNAHVAAREAGGITQAIGAYQVMKEGQLITFIDTPGHAAFTEMRARGASVTDIVVLVVAADDGVMPQTIEAIDHAKAAGVPMIVAVNKMDKPTANPDQVLTELAQHDVLPEKWGGDVPCVPISAKTGMGVDDLLDNILTIAELNEYKANPNRAAMGVVLEARLDKGKGPVATVVVQNGTLHEGDSLVVGNISGKIKTMIDEYHKKLKEALPSKAVEIDGLDEVPAAGDKFMVFSDEKTARAVAEKRTLRSANKETKKVSLNSLFEAEDGTKCLNIILKADVQGSVEAIKGSLAKINVEGVNVSVVHATAGNINDSDIKLAQASNAIIIGFGIRPNAATNDSAKSAGIEIRCYDIIYELLDDIEKAMKGLLEPVFAEKVIGEAEVKSLFKASKVGTIAGCMVTSGQLERNARARVIRDGVVVYTGELSSLKRFKDDVKEVRAGFECGLTITNFNDIKEGDLIEAFVMEQQEVI